MGELHDIAPRLVAAQAIRGNVKLEWLLLALKGRPRWRQIFLIQKARGEAVAIIDDTEAALLMAALGLPNV